MSRLLSMSFAVRMQAYYPDGSPYRNMRHAFASIYQEGATLATSKGASTLAGGLGALYRGVEATTIRGIVLSATQICSYDQIKQSLKKRGMMQEGVPLHLVASAFAGYALLIPALCGYLTSWSRPGYSVLSPPTQLVSRIT